MRITELFDNGQFVVTAEVGPPKGCHMEHVVEEAKEYLSGITAVNITDELFKAQAASEALRGQIKQYLDEAGKAQAEASELRREVFRLQQKLEGRGTGGKNSR